MNTIHRYTWPRGTILVHVCDATGRATMTSFSGDFPPAEIILAVLRAAIENWACRTDHPA